MKHFIFAVSLFTLFSCNSDSSSDNDSKAKELELKERELALKEKELKMNSNRNERTESSVKKEISKKSGSVQLNKVNKSDPESVVNQLIVAANTGNWNVLDGLCDPLLEEGKEMRRVCQLAFTSDAGMGITREDFIGIFKAAKTTGTSGECVPECGYVEVFLKSASTRVGHVTLVERNGYWYLHSF